MRTSALLICFLDVDNQQKRHGVCCWFASCNLPKGFRMSKQPMPFVGGWIGNICSVLSSPTLALTHPFCVNFVSVCCKEKQTN